MKVRFTENRNILVIVLMSSIIFASCHQDHGLTEVTTTTTTAKEKLLLMSSLKNYELKSHVIFQEKLLKVSNSFIETQSKEFVNKETGFFKIWSEALHYWESDVKKKARWKYRVDKYFRATAYSSVINDKQQAYSEIINLQREELLAKLYIDKNKLEILTPNISTISSTPEDLDQIVEKVNNLVLTEVIPEVIESIVFPLLWWLVVTVILGALSIPITGLWIKRILFIILLIVTIWKSISYSSELKNEIITRFTITDETHIMILPLLNQNTNDYYDELTKSIKPN